MIRVFVFGVVGEVFFDDVCVYCDGFECCGVFWCVIG